jgi:hypothetical protein
MGEFRPEDATPTAVLDGLRKNAIWCFAGGIVLLALRFVARSPVIAYIAGGALCAVGIGWLMAGNSVNRKTGILIIATGVLQALSRFPVPHIALFSGVALNIVMMWLFVTGTRNVISYFITQSRNRP